MNKSKRPAQQSASKIIEPPAFPTRGNNIFERIGAARCELEADARARYGFSYIQIDGRDVAAFAPVMARLAPGGRTPSPPDPLSRTRERGSPRDTARFDEPR